MRKYPERKSPEYTTVRLAQVDYKLLQKAKSKLERESGALGARRRKYALGWTIGALAEYYLKRKVI